MAASRIRPVNARKAPSLAMAAEAEAQSFRVARSFWEKGLMKEVCVALRVLSLSLVGAMAVAGAAHAAGASPDISGTYWATAYSARIQVLGGGDPPLNAAGKAAYEMIQTGLKDGSIQDKARRVCVPD